MLNKTKENLSAFKQKVLKLIEEMKIKNVSFKIEIHREKKLEVCRLIYRKDGLCRDEVDSLDASKAEVFKIYYCIKFKDDNKPINNYRKNRKKM